jgi:hypothetical protein
MMMSARGSVDDVTVAPVRLAQDRIIGPSTAEMAGSGQEIVSVIPAKGFGGGSVETVGPREPQPTEQAMSDPIKTTSRNRAFRAEFDGENGCIGCRSRL